MLLHALASPGSGFDIEQMVATLREDLDPAAFKCAWHRLFARHAVFRTSFEWEGLPEPQQRVHAHAPVTWIEDDWRAASETERAERLKNYLEEDRRRGFDPAEAPLTRCALFHCADREWIFVWTFHHILADGQSYPPLIQEAFEHYAAACQGRELALPKPPEFREFVEWQRECQRDRAGAAESYWKKALEGFCAATPLPRSEPGKPGFLEQCIRVPSGEIAEFTRVHGLTLNGLVQAAWAIALARHSGEEDVVFGVTRACRRNTVPGAERIVGSFINTVPVRVKIEQNLTVLGLLQQMSSERRAVREFEHTPLVDVQHWSDVPAGSPLFETLIVFTPRLVGAALREQGGAWLHREVVFHERTNFPLTLFAYGESELLLKLAYDRARFSDALISRLLAQLASVLQEIAANPDRPVADLSFLPEQERQVLVTQWNRTRRDYASHLCIHEAIEQQAAKTPDATAVVFRDETLTYAELNRRANLLARQLKKLGCGPDRLAGIYMERSLEMVVALLGVLKSGAAYVPLDPKYPRDRIAWVLEDTRVPVILTQSALVGSLPIHPCQLVLLDDAELWAESGAVANEPSGAAPHNLAYVIFTSGSNGRPKGVMIEHRNVLNFFAGMDESLDFRSAGTWLAVTSICFDISVLELFWTLSRGFKVIVQKEGELAPEPSAKRKIDFSLFYFAAEAGGANRDAYRILIEGAKFADRNGFSAVWTPERHFHQFGGLYPNAALTSAAVAAVTKNVAIRAGSVVLPLHNPIRVAEEWSVVDNLSGGRVGLSFASGWHANDFVLMPQNWSRRKELMFEGIETVKKLWRGESVLAPNGNGEQIPVRIFPPPLQREPEIWVTAATSIETFRKAGETGASLLTNLLGQKPEDLAQKIAAYREARRTRGHAGEGHVSLMLHTFVGASTEEVREIVRKPFLDYLKTSTELVKQARWEFPAFAQPGKDRVGAIGSPDLTPEEIDALMEHAFDRYFETNGLFGSAEDCLHLVEKLKAAGVDEIACLIDFGVSADTVLEHLDYLNDLRVRSNENTQTDYSIPAQIRRHKVTHFQCTPSMARMLAAEPDSLAALGSLEKMMVGGEAISPVLAEKLASALRGSVINMYGPTETTVWSTTAHITGGEVTIGRPIANTGIYIVDRNLRAVPTGAAGELLIGGEGVARGYLHRSELTRERFIPNPFGDGRVYRTGDVARYREDGRIEFLRRIDNQVKIRGYRIEPGEIESAIEQHPSVREAVVIVRTDASGDPQLAAYLAPNPGGYGLEAPGEAVHRWAAVWNETYRASKACDASFNVGGWKSSYTGEPLPEEDMREWVEATLERIRALKPRRVLEIGCGTGLLLFRLAPGCEQYDAVDVSEAAIKSVREHASRIGLTNVSLRQCGASDLGDIAPGSYDLVILNSVVQYFPSAEYLAQVLYAAMDAIGTGGAIFVGDVRHRGLAQAFYTSVELERAPVSLPTADLRRRIARRAESESELLLDPEFFYAIAEGSNKVGGVSIQLKRGKRLNEMTRFRYDVVLRADSRVAGFQSGTIERIDWTLEKVSGALHTGVAVGVRNARVAREIEAARLLGSPECPETVGALLERLGDPEGVDPEDLWTIDPNVELTWSVLGPEYCDAVPPGQRAHRPPACAARRLSEYANSRTMNRTTAALANAVREHLKARLPDFMVPAHITVLPALPRTPNGKIDRNALPAPEMPRRETLSAAPPRNETERRIASVWQNLLNTDSVGVEENFFDLGANSLTMVQASSLLRDALGRPVSLVDLFRFPSVRALADHLTKPATIEIPTNTAEDRGRARLDAMLRRMHARQVAAEEKGA
jgi:natural product biosynthesis luciferase-like monooxygenase protein